jgi:hypothetical protein
MLAEEKNIDQLFQEKLGDYQKTPPQFLWNNIESKLDLQQRTHRIIQLIRVGVAAAVMLAFLAGWWILNQTSPNIPVESKMAGTIIQKTETSIPANDEQPLNQGAISKESANESSEKSPVEQNEPKREQYKPSISSIATFAPNTSFLNKTSEASLVEKKDPILVDVEKEFLSHFQNNLKLIKQLSAWISSFNNIPNQIDTLRVNKPVYQVNKQYTISNTIYSPGAKTESTNKKGKWSVSAGITPVFTTQIDNAVYSSRQTTSNENSVSGNLMAGYRLGNRVIVKSGIIYSQVKQMTKNVNFTSGGPSSDFFGKTLMANTPSGKVNLSKISASKYEMSLAYSSSTLSGFQSDLKQDFSYIEIPVQATYKILNRKFYVGVNGGISTNILVANKADLFDNGQKINSGETSRLRNVSYSGAVGLELGYDLGNRITLTVEPRIKHFLTSLSSNNAVDFKPYQLNIVTGVTYSFN